MSAMLVNCGVLLEFTEIPALQVELPLPISDPTFVSKCPLVWGWAEPLVLQKKRTAKQPKSEKRIGGKSFPTDVGCCCLSHDMKPAPAERKARALGSSTEEGKEDLPERGSWEDYFSFPDVCYWVWCPIWWCCLFVVYLGEASPKRTQRLRLAPSRTPATDRQELSQSFRGHLSALGLLMLPFCSCLFLSSEVSPKRLL